MVISHFSEIFIDTIKDVIIAAIFINKFILINIGKIVFQFIAIIFIIAITFCL